MLLAILRILPRRSLELPFFGVDDVDERFLLLGVPLGFVFDEEGLEMVVVVVRSFFRLTSESK